MSQYPAAMLSDTARMELTVAASSRQSANQPRFLVILAILLLAGSLIYALTGVAARLGASASVQSAAGEARRILTLVDEVNRSATGPQEERYRPDPRMASRLEELAKGIGLKISGNISSGDGAAAAPFPGIQLKNFRAQAANQDPAIIMAWLNAAQDKAEFPGLDIYTLFLRPGASGSATTPNIPPPPPGLGPATEEAIFDGGWNVDVTFQRWERKGG